MNKHTDGTDMTTERPDDNSEVLESSKAPAEALRQHYKQEIEYVLETSDESGEVRITYADGHSEIKPAKVLLLDDIMHFVDAYVTAYAATVEREAASRELKQLIADTLTPENVGGHFIHDEVKEFAKQQRAFIDDRLAALQGPRVAATNTKESNK